MSDTPRTDRFTEPFNARELLREAKNLERELSAAQNLAVDARLMIDRLDCSARDGNGTLHCRIDSLCLTCRYRAAQALTDRIRAALNTEETDNDLVQVARNSHAAEQMCATLSRNLDEAREESRLLQARVAELEKELHNRHERLLEERDYHDMHAYTQRIIDLASRATGSSLVTMQTRIIGNELSSGWMAKKELIAARQRVAELEKDAARRREMVLTFLDDHAWEMSIGHRYCIGNSCGVHENTEHMPQCEVMQLRSAMQEPKP